MPETPKDVSKPPDVGFTIIDTHKVKLPSVYILLPPEIISELGGIVVAWGLFEQSFMDLLGAMIEENGTAANYKRPWRFFPFDNRREMFEAEAAKCFASEPDILSRLTSLMAETKPLQIKRNLLVHGRFVLRIDADPAIIVTGEHKKQERTEAFTRDGINDLYYEILHVAGRMAQFAWPELGHYVPPISSHDRSRLRAVALKSPLRQSMPSMLLPPRPPSAE